MRDAGDATANDHIDQAQQGAVCVGERPHEATRFVRYVQVRPHLEALERLEDQTERRKQEKRPPSNAHVAADVEHVID